ncbi:unnamed protein product [Microthlaspi erraticum]|uniref:Uncharacterized protein n=1 Tax=Microthlaspi erraticum TaxID=1685480 RepID=A0A6D2IQE5_9BRAS|nr:unnamed protein product [Microthlaspi erraticum]
MKQHTITHIITILPSTSLESGTHLGFGLNKGKKKVMMNSDDRKQRRTRHSSHQHEPKPQIDGEQPPIDPPNTKTPPKISSPLNWPTKQQNQDEESGCAGF